MVSLTNPDTKAILLALGDKNRYTIHPAGRGLRNKSHKVLLRTPWLIEPGIENHS